MEFQPNLFINLHYIRGKLSQRRFPILISALLMLVILFSSCSSTTITESAVPLTKTPTIEINTPTPTPTFTPIPTVVNTDYLQVFEVVWSTIDQTYFDPDFGGLDWNAIHDQYEPLIATAEDDHTLYQLLNQMLWELKVSHTGVGPVDEWPNVEPAIWKSGETGIDLRLLNDQAVITRIKAGSPAGEAGLRPGFIIQSIEGVSVEQIITGQEENLAPPYNEQGRIDNLTRHLLSLIYGDPGTCVTLAYMDENDELSGGCIKRIQRQRVGHMDIPISPSYLEFESDRLESDIGYIRFNTFHPDLVPDMIEAIAELQDAPGMIIDLRGNPGGDPNTADQLAAQFMSGQVNFGAFKARSGIFTRSFEGADTYSGPLVILIDALSFSGSEYFASGMQAFERAAIIGQRSPGGLTGMNVIEIQNNAILGYPVVQHITPNGEVLEGVGVEPDIEVRLTRDELLLGIDSQLEVAIDYLLEQMRNEVAN